MSKSAKAQAMTSHPKAEREADGVARAQGKQAEEQLEDAKGNADGQSLKGGSQKEAIFNLFLLRPNFLFHVTSILVRLCQKKFALIYAKEFSDIEVDCDHAFISQFYSFCYRIFFF